MDVLLDTNLLIRCIPTFNSKDFARYRGIKVVVPEDLSAAWTRRAGAI